jgi:hypothetical protein
MARTVESMRREQGDMARAGRKWLEGRRDMRGGPAKRVRIEARLLADPCLWCWEVRDAHGKLVESSWANYWTAYPSREEALAAASSRPSVNANVFGIPGAA